MRMPLALGDLEGFPDHLFGFEPITDQHQIDAKVVVRNYRI